uniref:Uncharacterized protein n=1 Tax=Strombidium inclinatum TaxID=197538 RepID=A0A7S3N083_9SPIT
MAGHHFVLETLAEVLEAVLCVVAFELVHVLDLYVAIGPDLNFEARHPHERAFLRPVGVGVEQVIHSLVIQLDILACDRYFVGRSAHLPSVGDSGEELANSPGDDSVLVVDFLSRVLGDLGHEELGLHGMANVLVAFHGISFS